MDIIVNNSAEGNEKYSYWCRNEVDSDAFLKQCEELGYTWVSGKLPTQKNNWDEEKEFTCYEVEDNIIYYCDLTWYITSPSYVIVEFTENGSMKEDYTRKESLEDVLAKLEEYCSKFNDFKEVFKSETVIRFIENYIKSVKKDVERCRLALKEIETI